MATFKQRLYEFANGIETSTQPDAGTPVSANDLLTLSFAQSSLTFAPQLNGLTTITATGLTYTHTAGRAIQITPLQATSGVTPISGNPQISAGTIEGYILVLMGMSDYNYPVFNTGNGLFLNGELKLPLNAVAGFVWKNSLWHEMFRNGVSL